MRIPFIIAGAIALATAWPIAAASQTNATPAPAALPSSTPTPIPLTNPNASPLPYPAYGTPAPGVAAQKPAPGVPQTVTLDQAVAIAAAKSPVLSTARAVLAQAHAPISLAKTAALPSITGTASSTHNNGTFNTSGANGRPGGVIGSSSTNNSLSLNLRQLIYDGGRVIAQLHTARSNYAAATGTFERSYQTLVFNVATAYYNALQAHHATLLDEQVVYQNQVQENLVNAQLRAGTASRVDVATAELPVAQARVALVTAQGNELQADAAFANALGLDADTLVRPADDASANSTRTLLSSEPLSYDTAVTRALLLRPDYIAAQQTVEAQKENLRFQKLGMMPTLSGSANYGTSSTLNNGTDFGPNSGIGLTLTLPIYDQGVTRAQTELAQGQLDQALGQLAQSKLTVQLNVQQALVNFVSAQAALTQTQAELSKAQEILKATQAQYRAGVTTLPLLLNAQVGLTTAQTDQLNAVYALRQAEQSYLYALGQNGP